MVDPTPLRPAFTDDDRRERAHDLGIAIGRLLETWPADERPAVMEKAITSMRGGLRPSVPPDLKTEAERALLAWLDTVAPESKLRALETMVARVRWTVEHGHTV